MRKKQSFLLTILPSEEQNASLCGKIKVISSGEVYTFTNLEELNQIVTAVVHQQLDQSLLAEENREKKQTPNGFSL